WISTTSTIRAIPILTERAAHPHESGFMMRGSAGEIPDQRRRRDVIAANLHVLCIQRLHER
ncbi:MAG: hypothetical protein KDE66_08350, partial [Nitrosomonas sp.]|nr:hypothetical protein [Nitrosomonas sp.]